MAREEIADLPNGAGKPANKPTKQQYLRRKRSTDSEPDLKKQLEKMKEELSSNKKMLREFSGIIGSLNAIDIEYEKDPSSTHRPQDMSLANVKRKIEAMEEFRKKAMLKIKALKKENKSKDAIIASQEVQIRTLEDHICHLETLSPVKAVEKKSKQSSRIEQECKTLMAKNHTKDIKICSLEARLGQLTQCQKEHSKDMKLRKSYKSLKESSASKNQRIASLEAKIRLVTRSLSDDDANHDLRNDNKVPLSPRSATLESIDEGDEPTQEETLTSGSDKSKVGRVRPIEPRGTEEERLSIRAVPSYVPQVDISIHQEPATNVSPITFCSDDVAAHAIENGNLTRTSRPPADFLNYPNLSSDSPAYQEQGGPEGHRQIISRLQQLNDKYEILSRNHDAALSKIKELEKVDSDHKKLLEVHEAALLTIEVLQKNMDDIDVAKNDHIAALSSIGIPQLPSGDNSDLIRDYEWAANVGQKIESAKSIAQKGFTDDFAIEFEKLKLERQAAVKKYDELRRTHVGVVAKVATLLRSTGNNLNPNEYGGNDRRVSSEELVGRGPTDRLVRYHLLGDMVARTLVDASKHYEAIREYNDTVMILLEKHMNEHVNLKGAHDSTLAQLESSLSQNDLLTKKYDILTERNGMLEQKTKHWRIQLQLISSVQGQRSERYEQITKEQTEAISKIEQLEHTINDLGEIKQRFEAEEAKVEFLERDLEEVRQQAKLLSSARDEHDVARSITLATMKQELEHAVQKADRSKKLLQEREIDLRDVLGHYKNLQRDHHHVLKGIRQLETSVASGKPPIENPIRDSNIDSEKALSPSPTSATDSISFEGQESEGQEREAAPSSLIEHCDSVLLRLHSIETMAQATRNEVEEANALREASKADLLMVLRHYKKLQRVYNTAVARRSSKDDASCASLESECENCTYRIDKKRADSTDNHSQESSVTGDGSVAESYVTTATVHSSANAIELIYRSVTTHQAQNKPSKQGTSAETLEEKYRTALDKIKSLERNLRRTRNGRSKQEEDVDSLGKNGHEEDSSSVDSTDSPREPQEMKGLNNPESNGVIEFHLDSGLVDHDHGDGNDHDDDDDDDKSLFHLVERAQLRYKELEDKFTESNVRIEILEHQLRQAQQETFEAQRQRALRDDKLRDVISKHRKLDHEYHQRETRIAELEHQVETAKREIRKAEYESVNTRRRLAASHHQYKTLQDEYQATVEEMEGMQSELVDAKVLASLGDGEELMAKNARLVQQNAEIKSLCEELVAEKKRAVQENSDLNSLCQEVLAEKKKLLQGTTELKALCDRLLVEKKRLVQENFEIKALRDELLAEKQRLIQENVETKSSYDAKLLICLGDLEDLLAENKRLGQEKADIKFSYESKYVTSLGDVDSLRADKQKLVQEISETKSMWEAKLLTSLAALDELMTEKKKLEKENGELKSSYEDKLFVCLGDIEELLAEKERLVQENAEIKALCEELLAMVEQHQIGGRGDVGGTTSKRVARDG